MSGATNTSEGLRLARGVMVLSSLSPLFVLLAIRGVPAVPDIYLLPVCAALVLVPNGFLLWRILVARRNEEFRTLEITQTEDQRDHLLVYLFAMLLPFYGDWLNEQPGEGHQRASAAAICALLFIVFLFWHLRLHYMNILFALFGFHVFTIRSDASENPLSGKRSIALITRRDFVSPGLALTALRISTSVYFEGKHESAL